MAAANLDELRFFLDDRDDLAERVRATGASTTEVMLAIGVHENQLESRVVPATLADERVLDVCMILDQNDDVEELSLDDVQWLS
ncbi:MAG: hypothetical protein ABI678_08225 [Kofleriaceae bacterium]